MSASASRAVRETSVAIDMNPSTVPNVKYTSGARDPSPQSGNGATGKRGEWKRIVAGNGDGSSAAGKRVRYGIARMASSTSAPRSASSERRVVGALGTYRACARRESFTALTPRATIRHRG